MGLAVKIAKGIFGIGGKKAAAPSTATQSTDNAPQPVISPLSGDQLAKANRRRSSLFAPQYSSSILSNTLGG